LNKTPCGLRQPWGSVEAESQADLVLAEAIGVKSGVREERHTCGFGVGQETLPEDAGWQSDPDKETTGGNVKSAPSADA
jgi:hypothetical protein